MGCFHVDFGAKILTISSFSSLKRALICNNMLTVNIFGLCALRNLICRFKVSIESFRFRKRSMTFKVLKLVSINVVLNIDSLRVLNIFELFESCLERRLDTNIRYQSSDCFVCVYATI